MTGRGNGSQRVNLKGHWYHPWPVASTATSALTPLTVAKIVDIGDIPFPCANDNDDCIERITEFFRRVDATGARPICEGGDHSISGGIVQAIC